MVSIFEYYTIPTASSTTRLRVRHTDRELFNWEPSYQSVPLNSKILSNVVIFQGFRTQLTVFRSPYTVKYNLSSNSHNSQTSYYNIFPNMLKIKQRLKTFAVFLEHILLITGHKLVIS